MLTWVKRSYLPWFVAAIPFATGGCGSDPPTTPRANGGAGALAGNAGANSLTAGTNSAGTSKGGNRFDTIINSATEASDPEVEKKYQACMSYIKAQCERRTKDCGERFSVEDACIASLDRCPDITFSAGSSWTADTLLSCAEEWKNFSCDDIRQNKRPSCADAKGTRQVGEPCLFAHQCTTGSCSKTDKDGNGVPGYANCGVCGEVLGVGGDCLKSGYDCTQDLTCNISSGKCERRPTVGVVGESCNDDSTCGGYGINCRKDPTDGVKRCLLYPTEGEACTDAPCADGFTCTDKVCVSAPGMGQTCAGRGAAQCASGLACTSRFDDPPNACVSPRQLGETCLGDSRRAPRGSCAQGLRCDCGDVDCDLKSGTCKTPRSAGDSCTDSDSICVPGTLCLGGSCVPVDSQQVLKSKCPS